MTTMPVLFVGHGAPLLAIDAERGRQLRELAGALPRPAAILCISAHWERAPAVIGATETRPLIYDFRGFPAPLYQVQYPAPGAPALADRVDALLGAGTARQDRGLDHGVWTPLVHMWPRADVPVLQLSLPTARGATAIFELGARLATLREEGVLIIGSGNITHNLRAMGPDGTSPEAWAAELDEWTRATCAARDFDGLLGYRERAPAFGRNHPSEDHWLPLIAAAGAASTLAGPVAFPVEGFEFRNLSRRAVLFG